MPKTNHKIYSEIAKNLRTIIKEVAGHVIAPVATSRLHLRDSGGASKTAKDRLSLRVEKYRKLSSQLLDVVGHCISRMGDKRRSDILKYYDFCTAVTCLHYVYEYGTPTVPSHSYPVALRETHVTRLVSGHSDFGKTWTDFKNRYKPKLKDLKSDGSRINLDEPGFPIVGNVPAISGDLYLPRDIGEARILVKQLLTS